MTDYPAGGSFQIDRLPKVKKPSAGLCFFISNTVIRFMSWVVMFLLRLGEKNKVFNGFALNRFAIHQLVFNNFDSNHFDFIFYRKTILKHPGAIIFNRTRMTRIRRIFTDCYLLFCD